MDQRYHKQRPFPIYIDTDTGKIIEEIIGNIFKRQAEEFDRRFFVKGDGYVSRP